MTDGSTMRRRTALGGLAAFTWGGAGIGAAALAGCSGASLLPPPPAAPALYGLDDGAPTASPATPPPPGAPSLLLSLPRAAAGLDTRLIAYQRTPLRTEFYARSEWLDTPPRLLAPLLLRALDATGAFSAVLPAPAFTPTRWRLDTELLRLQQEFGASPPSQLRLTLRATLIDSAGRRVLGTREFDLREPAPSEDAAGAVAAAQVAAQALGRGLAAWCADVAARQAGRGG
jgi:cholesterol transport system auxiliary component